MAASRDAFAARRVLTACLEKEGRGYAWPMAMASPVLYIKTGEEKPRLDDALNRNRRGEREIRGLGGRLRLGRSLAGYSLGGTELFRQPPTF